MDMITRADGTQFMPVKEDGTVYRQGVDKPGQPLFDPRIKTAAQMHESLYPKLLYRLKEGVKPFTDTMEMNSHLGHVVVDDPQYDPRFFPNLRAMPTKPKEKLIDSLMVFSEDEENDAKDEGWGPLANCLSVTETVRVSKVDKLQAAHDAELAERDARLAAMETKMEALLNAAPVRNKPGPKPKLAA